MSEQHPMRTTWRSALWRQFGAAIDMLENALLACPDTLWQEHLWIDPEGPDYGTFWDITYHSLYWLDLYLTGGSVEAFTPPAPFKRRSDAVTANQPYSRDELHTYLKHLRQQCQSTIAELSNEQAHQPFHFPWDSDNPISYGELLLYTLRHVQEHAAHLSLFLGQHGVPGEALDWVARAQEEAGL